MWGDILDNMAQEEVSIEQWLSNYESEKSSESHRGALIKFFEAVYQIPRKEIKSRLNELSLQYIHEARASERNINDDVSTFNKALRDYAPTTRSVRFSSVNLFFKVNKLEVNRELWRIATTTGKNKNVQPITKERVPTREEVARIINYLPFHAKVVSIMLVSSGMRPGEPFKLRLNQITRIKERPMRIDLESAQTKTKVGRYVFISDEARGFLTEWLDYRDTFVKSIRNKAKGLSPRKDDKTDKVFPFSAVNYRKLWRSALKKAGLFEADSRTGISSITPKSMRKFFRTRGNWSNPEIAEFLMGHKQGGIGTINGRNDLTTVYARYQDVPEIVRDVYIEAEPNLMIFGNTPELYELRIETDELRKVAQTKGDEIIEKSELVKYIRRDLGGLKNENRRLTNQLNEMAERMGSLDGLKERIQEQTQRIEELTDRLRQRDENYIQVTKTMIDIQDKMSKYSPLIDDLITANEQGKQIPNLDQRLKALLVKPVEE